MMRTFTDEETARSKHYSRNHFTDPGRGVEAATFCRGELREDEFSAAWYAMGVYGKPPWAPDQFETQLRWLADGGERRGRVLDVGCGRGMLAAVLSRLGFLVKAIDFSEQAVGLTIETVKERGDINFCDVVHAGLCHIDKFDWEIYPETVIFSESIEHIPEDEFWGAFQTIKSWHPLLIIVNYRHLHPIPVDNTKWNHITPIDDAVYDRIAEHGETKLRQTSHLVVQL